MVVGAIRFFTSAVSVWFAIPNRISPPKSNAGFTLIDLVFIRVNRMTGMFSSEDASLPIFLYELF